MKTESVKTLRFVARWKKQTDKRYGDDSEVDFDSDKGHDEFYDVE